MHIVYDNKYNRDLKKLKRKNMFDELERIDKIKDIILSSDNLHELLISQYSIIYGISQKHGDLREIITAKVNSKLRLWMKPVGEYPYKYITILEIEFLKIDDKHYEEG